jgi:hypothetical protein
MTNISDGEVLVICCGHYNDMLIKLQVTEPMTQGLAMMELQHK